MKTRSFLSFGAPCVEHPPSPRGIYRAEPIATDGPVTVLHPRPAEAKAVEGGEVLFFPREAFMGLLERNPRFSLNLIISLSLSLRRFARQIEELSFAEVPARLAAYLVELVERKSTSYQGKIYLDLDMKKGELASRLGTVSETLSRSLKKMKDEGIIEVEGSRVIILSLEQLTRLAGR